jgi:tyrosine-protein phosphatase YwqE
MKHKAKFVKKLLKNGLVDFIASDAHFNRENHMKQAYSIICKKYGEKVAQDLFINNAKAIIKG